ncbi:pyridoxal-phosphate dependent enzyme [bacterium]|nr:pyridoxal-phosphate dependent enzyme [candidate division CSSED10-310 bacterium]
MSDFIYGPTYSEMLHPETIDPAVRRRAIEAITEDPLDPINLFNISWRDERNALRAMVLPPELTGVEAPIAVLYAKDFPTGSHKVGATYSVLLENQLEGRVNPRKHTLIWPSTGNYGIGGAWVGCRMQFDCIVILPEEMSQERFDIVERYGARLIKTPGCESNVKEIYDKSNELHAQDPDRIRILNQFSELGNYRFHYHVTGNAVAELAGELHRQGVGDGSVAAFVSAMGSSGTIAAGDRLKQLWPSHKIVGLEPIQCPTIYSNGYGGHNIQGIGDKHVTWIHNVMNMDMLACIDDRECEEGLQLLTEEPGWNVLIRRYGIAEETVRKMSTVFGLSGICNVLGAIKTARYYGFGKNDLIVTICTDALDRYHTEMAKLTAREGIMDEAKAVMRMEAVFRRQKLDYIQESTLEIRRRWHHLKYYTWVEQQGKTVAELNAQMSQEWWCHEQERIDSIQKMLLAAR